MNKVKIIKKIKANIIRLRLHRFFGFAADLLIYTGYLLKLSRWIDKNKKHLSYNDFYNRKVTHKDREKLYQFFSDEMKLAGIPVSYLEFGVGRGNSLRWWTGNNNHPASQFWAFDTYEGLPEKYGTYDKGVFSLDGKFPELNDERINFIKGLFQETLLSTIPEINFKSQVIVHIDSDLYSAALYTLACLYPHLKEGDYIIFDEFVVPGHEFKAYDDFIKSFYIRLEPVAAINNYLQMIFKIKKVNSTQ
ncbi:MAG: TylF/MycF family methyltransferase [Bacteroidales bacterium]|nr:TylF/MycF family methyltransferase [Bacteroidales bacterium]